MTSTRNSNIKEYNYALSPTSQFFFCGVPFRLDSSPKCALDCMYCFAMARGGRRTKQNQYTNPQKILMKLEKAQKRPLQNISSELLNNKTPLHFGGLSDPFSESKTIEISQKLLRTLAYYDYPVIISTKNPKILLRKKVLPLILNSKIIIQISISSIDKKFSKRIEPNSPNPFNRIKIIKELTNLGLPVFARVQPYFPWREKEICNELIPALAEARTNHVIVEYLKLPTEKKSLSIKNFSNACEFDIQDFYQNKGAVAIGREWILPTSYIWENIQQIIESIHRYGMTYGSADYGINHLGDTECCCGVDKIKGFENYFRGSFTSFIRNSKKEHLFFKDFEKKKFPSGSIKRYINSECRIEGKNNILEIMKSKWNRPGTVNSPNTFLGVRLIKEFDDDGNCVYYKNKEMI